jgi:hypothetical protein
VSRAVAVCQAVLSQQSAQERDDAEPNRKRKIDRMTEEEEEEGSEEDEGQEEHHHIGVLMAHLQKRARVVVEERGSGCCADHQQKRVAKRKRTGSPLERFPDGDGEFNGDANVVDMEEEETSQAEAVRTGDEAACIEDLLQRVILTMSAAASRNAKRRKTGGTVGLRYAPPPSTASVQSVVSTFRVQDGTKARTGR